MTGWAVPCCKNDSSVRLSQGDMMLCPECDRYRFPKTNKARSTKQTNQPARKDSSKEEATMNICEGANDITAETMTTVTLMLL